MHVFIPGGAGYVGSLLVPALIEAGYVVTVYDLFLQGKEVFNNFKDHPNLILVKGDVRDLDLMEEALNGSDTILHLACSLESLEVDSFESFVKIAKKKVANRFIFTSSFAVYGNLEINTEKVTPQPLTAYAKFKAACEKLLLKQSDDNLACTILRPGSIFGKAPWTRPGNTFNVFANHACNGDMRETESFGYYPMVHIRDLIAVYLQLLKTPVETIKDEIYNVGYHTLSFAEIRERVEGIVSNHSYLRSYKEDLVSSKKIAEHLGFFPKFTIEDGIQELIESSG